MPTDLFRPSSLALVAEGNPLMREVFGNVPKISKFLFYVAAAVALGIFAYGIYRRVKLWRMGRPSSTPIKFGTAARQWLTNVLLQRRVLGRGLASVAHVSMFSGFVVLFVGTLLIALEHILADLLGREPSNPLFHKGLYYAIYEVLLDAFGLVFLFGCTLFLFRRMRHRQLSIDHNASDYLIIVSLILIGITGYVVEGLRIIEAETVTPEVSFVGLAGAQLFESFGIDQPAAALWHQVLWWAHAALALTFIAAMPYTRLLHVLAGSLNLPAQTKQMGTLVPISMEEVEETGMIGVGSITDFTARELLALDACVSCGRCQDACPAFEAGKPLSPRDVVQDLRGHMMQIAATAKANGSSDDSGNAAECAALHGDTIGEDTIWSCTTCSACVDVCPLGVRPMDYLTDMRRFLIGEGSLRGSPATALQKSQRVGNPWGLPPDERFDWAEGLDVPTTTERPDFDVLYWVGCAASYDRRVQKVARSVVRLLKAAEVNFAVLGNDERCTGESARRMGDEFLFQELAMQNVETLSENKVRKIVTHCPHCFNSLQNDYPQMGGEYEVIHHSQFLAELADAGRLPLDESGEAAAKKITFHDPCYLARANGITEEPRQLVQLSMNVSSPSAGSPAIVEMPRNGRQTACCGGGGGRMWFDDAVDERIGQSRVDEALATGADTVAVSCPFCLVMMNDGVAAKDENTQVRDIAEILADRLAEGGGEGNGDVSATDSATGDDN